MREGKACISEPIFYFVGTPEEKLSYSEFISIII
jgi:hypothetical protein